MNSTPSLEDVLEIALKLGPKERLQLIERVASSVEREIQIQPISDESPEIHWGQNLLRLLDELGPIELDYPEIEDPVAWVKQIRRDQEKTCN